MALGRPGQLCVAVAFVAGLPTCARSETVPATPAGHAATTRVDTVGPRSSADERSVATRLDERIRGMQQERGVAGVSVAVVWRGKPVLVRSYGLADVPKNVPMRTDNVFRIGSITKSFTAAAILVLEAQGKLELTDPLAKYLPEYTASNAVTVRHLLTHTSGIPDYLEVPNFGTRMTAAKTRSELAAWFAGLPLQFAPGSDWAYGNSGYFLLGLVIEAVSGKSYADFVSAEILAPAGLHDTRYCPDAQDYARAAYGYKLVEGKLVPDDPAVMKLTFSAGALCSTASDLVKWIATLSRGRSIAPEAFSRMIAPTALTDGRAEPYGFGLALRELGGHVRVGHYGDINGFAAALHYYLNDDLSIAVLVNTEGDAAKSIAEESARIVLDSKEPNR